MFRIVQIQYIRGIRSNESGEILEVYGVPNLTWDNISKPTKARGWKCGRHSITMKLFPISKDIPAEYWSCHECNNQITLQQRDAVFEEIRAAIQDKYFLHTFNYGRQNNNWTIESSEWVTENGTRLDSKRKRITSDFRKELIDHFKAALEHTLEIEIENIKDYFLDV
ncbi:MAG: hypothetical protein WCF23_22100 [Candidatus Nitrosopolaris sp.]